MKKNRIIEARVRSDNEYIIDFSEGNLSEKEYKEFELKLTQDEALRMEYMLFKKISSTMQKKFELEVIENDPKLKEINAEVKEMISNYQANPNKYKNIKEFVVNSLENIDSNNEVEEELKQINLEIEESGINQISTEWVNEWNKDKANQANSNINEIKNFVSSSLSSDDQQPIIKITQSRTAWYNSSLIRIIGLSAAALIVLLLVIRTFNYSTNTIELYENYYKPFDAISIVTRNSENSISNLYEDAIEKYKQGDYQSAASLFIEVTNNDQKNPAPKFFLGISQIELNDYQLAINSLVEVIEMNGNYKKEAQWYLGLTYLKTGELQKAKLCFQELAIKPGYYQNQAQDLFNHLK